MRQSAKFRADRSKCCGDITYFLLTYLLKVIRKKEKVYEETKTGDISRVRPDHPRRRSSTWICMCGHTHNVVIYISSFIEIYSGVSEPNGVEICSFPLLWLFAFTTTCSTVQAVAYTLHAHENVIRIKLNT